MTVVILAPVVTIGLSIAALSAGFCQDSKPVEDCPSIGSITTLFRFVVSTMGATYLGCVVALIRSARRVHGTPIASTHREIDEGVRANAKAVAAGGFAAIAALSSLRVVLGGAAGTGALGFLIATPAALLAIVFGLRSLAELHHASGRESGTAAATASFVIGAVVAVGWIFSAAAV